MDFISTAVNSTPPDVESTTEASASNDAVEQPRTRTARLPNFDLNGVDPVLNESDITGPHIEATTVASFPNNDLKLWLKFRGLFQTGPLQVLIQR